MLGELYMVPLGVVEQQVVTVIEIYIPDLLLIVAPGNSSLIENKKEAEERYEEFKKIGDIEIPDEDEQYYIELKQAIENKNILEETCLTHLDSVVSEAIHEFQSEPQIHIPTLNERSQLMGDGKSGIIIEG